MITSTSESVFMVDRSSGQWLEFPPESAKEGDLGSASG